MKVKKFALTGLILSILSWGHYFYFIKYGSDKNKISKNDLEETLVELNNYISPIKVKSHCSRVLTTKNDRLVLRDFKGKKVFSAGEKFKRIKIEKFELVDVQKIRDFLMATLILEIRDSLGSFNDRREMKLFYKDDGKQRQCLTYFEEFYI